MPYTSRQQLLSTRTVAAIARSIHQEDIEKLIFRKYLYSVYDPYKNLWETQGDTIDWENSSGNQIVRMYNLRKVDNATQSNQVVADDPATMRNETIQAAEDGTNVIAPIFTRNGRRNSDMVNIHAVSAIVRLHVERGSTEAGEPFDVSYTDRVKFKFGFYTWRKITAAGLLDNTDTPDIRTLIPWKPVGYSAQLDNEEAGINQGLPYATRNLNMIMNSEKVKTLAQKDITINVPSSVTNLPEYRQVRIYKELKPPLQLQFDTLSQDGSIVLNQKLYFAIRSDLSDDIVTLDNHAIMPRAQICTKIYYSNVN